MTDAPLWYGLDEKPITIEQADEVLRNPARIIGRTQVGPMEVSTVFLVVDHGLGQGSPILYETMIFGLPGDRAELTWRYTTRAEAETGHHSAVKIAEILNKLTDHAGS